MSERKLYVDFAREARQRFEALRQSAISDMKARADKDRQSMAGVGQMRAEDRAPYALSLARATRDHVQQLQSGLIAVQAQTLRDMLRMANSLGVLVSSTSDFERVRLAKTLQTDLARLNSLVTQMESRAR